MSERKVPEGKVVVPLSSDRLRERARELAAITREIDDVVEEWAEKSKAHRRRLEGMEERRRELGDDIEFGTELRDAQAELDFFSPRSRDTVTLDRGARERINRAIDDLPADVTRVTARFGGEEVVIADRTKKKPSGAEYRRRRRERENHTEE